jgi:hypothetical protein
VVNSLVYLDRSTRWPNIRIFQTQLFYLEVIISAVDPDPYPDRIRISMGYLDPNPDPHSQSGSGSGFRRAKMTQEHRKKLLNFIVSR